ncbi:MAG: response regulator [Geitlerinemataceae cyanobacterium]
MSEKAIICVDDEAIVLKSLKEQMMRSLGDEYIFEVSDSPEEALEIIEELNEDGVSIVIVVSDWLMPQMKGDEFLIEVHRKFPEIVTILLTGQADEEAIDRAKQEANLHCCIRKPWNEKELTKTLKAALATL